jgi:hypothetical protein
MKPPTSGELIHQMRRATRHNRITVISNPRLEPQRSTPEAIMSITYARFSNYAAAREASNLIQKEIGNSGRVRLLRDSKRLSHHITPLCMTGVRFGTFFGGAVVAMLSLFAGAACVLLLGAFADIPVPLTTLLLSVGLSTLLGSLAGAICFATDTSAVVQRMQEWLREGKPVVLVEARGGHEQTMRLLGADANTVGKIG